jgi:predicted membrane channel-forming protein YqfA (hemolysin III family)
MKWKHTLMMLVGCALPLLLIFIAPLLGIRGNWSVFIFVAAMFACHLFMPMHHYQSDKSKKTNHEPLSH